MNAQASTSSQAAYFNWLYSHIGADNDRNPRQSHWLLAEVLHNRIFEWSVPNDDNRAMDGIYLRELYVHDQRANTKLPGTLDMDPTTPCSMLEMLIGLAFRMNFEDSPDPEHGVGVWFWRLMQNLGLDEFTDEVYTSEPGVREIVEGIVDNVINRNYNANGAGGLFPLKNMKNRQDQRLVEIWYQMSAYLIENLESD